MKNPLYEDRDDIGFKQKDEKKLVALSLPDLRIPGSDMDWQLEAACKDMEIPVDFFSPLVGERAKAKKVCSTCTVKDECLDFASSNWEDFGVWGGTTSGERKAMRT